MLIQLIDSFVEAWLIVALFCAAYVAWGPVSRQTVGGAALIWLAVQ